MDDLISNFEKILDELKSNLEVQEVKLQQQKDKNV